MATAGSRPSLLRRPWLWVPMLLVDALLVYAVTAWVLYDRVPSVAAPCRDCATPVTVLDHQLYLRALGADTTRPPIVVLHGGPGHSSQSFKGKLDFLGATHRVVFYDQRGSGYSSATGRREDYTVHGLVEELEAIRRDVLQAERIIVLGHSFGGALAQRYALAHPDRVERMVLVGSTPANNGMGNAVVWRWLGPGLWATVLGFPPADPGRADRWFAEDSEDSADRLFDRSRAAEVLGDSGPVRFTTWRDVLRSVAGPLDEPGLRRLQVPTLVIYGVADSPFTGQATAEAICGLVPDCQAARFDRSGHWPFLEEPDRFRDVMTTFLTSRR